MKKLIPILIMLTGMRAVNAQDLNRVRTYLDTLCAPGMHGRGYVNHGESIAAGYLEAQYKDIGLLPFSATEVHPYYQYFTLDVNTFPDTVCLKADRCQLFTGQDYILHPASGSGKGCLKTHYIDTLLFTDEKARKKFLKLKTENFCLIMADFPRFRKNWENDLPEPVAEKIFSSGCLIRLQKEKLTASLAPVQYRMPYFEVLEKAFPHTVSKVCFDVNAKLEKSYRSQNVIGYIRGKTYPDSFIVISAHYDHLGRMGSDTYFPGANDNGSGISMMLELARYYTEHTPSCSMAFMAFGSEEAGLVGSRYYTNHPLFRLSAIKFLINLDLEGTGDEGITVVNATTQSAAFDAMVKINEAAHYLPAVKARGPAANSDHYFFAQKGVPSFFIYTLGGIAAYHDIYDRPETLPLTKFSGVFHLLQDFIRVIDTNYAGK